MNGFNYPGFGAGYDDEFTSFSMTETQIGPPLVYETTGSDKLARGVIRLPVTRPEPIPAPADTTGIGGAVSANAGGEVKLSGTTLLLLALGLFLLIKK